MPVGPWVEWATSLWVNLLLNLFAFTMIYRVVPRAKIRWWDALRGGLLAAVLWELGRQALTTYFLHLNYPSAYGIIGSFIAVMLWAFYASVVLLFGAEYVRVLREEAREEYEHVVRSQSIEARSYSDGQWAATQNSCFAADFDLMQGRIYCRKRVAGGGGDGGEDHQRQPGGEAAGRASRWCRVVCSRD